MIRFLFPKLSRLILVIFFYVVIGSWAVIADYKKFKDFTPKEDFLWVWDGI